MESIETFTYSSTTPKVLFGPGQLRNLPPELRALEAEKPLIISSPSRTSLSRTIKELLARASIADVELLDTALVHNPEHAVGPAVERAKGRDVLVSVGGGSAVGLGKAIALRTGLPHISIPTTYSGSEMTPILGETKNGKKVTTVNPRILPTAVIYDVELTMELPLRISCPSGINALAHALEALYARNSNPVSTTLALESVRLLSSSLPQLMRDPRSEQARSSILYGAMLSGMLPGTTGIALHHKLAHAVGGTLNLPHAETHAILLPHSIAYNGRVITDALVRRLAGVLAQSTEASLEGVVAGLNSLVGQLEIPQGLRQLGMKEGDVARVVDVAMQQPYWNPREVEDGQVREMVARAWAGDMARADL